MTLFMQLGWLFILPLPIACIAWTITQEEVFSGTRKYCVQKSKDCKSLLFRKFFYIFTCEYCFSHYVTLGILLLTGYKLLLEDWRGYILAAFALVWMANLYMGLFKLLRQSIKMDITEINLLEKESQ